MKPSLKPAFIVATFGVCLSLLSVAIWFDANDPKKDMVFGRVAEVGTSTLVLVDREGGKKDVLIDQSTEVFKGKEKVSLDALSLGNFVHVGFSKDESTTSHAMFIRIMNDQKKDNRHESR